MRFLLVEDDLMAARDTARTLRIGGSIVDHTDIGEEALDLLRHYQYDLVLLDIVLPDTEGYEVLRQMRLAHNNTPVIILLDLNGLHAKVKGLEMGADDCLTKPIDSAELLARIRAIIRRCKGFGQPNIRICPLEINLDSHEATVDGKAVTLTRKEYEICKLFLSRNGMVISKKDIFDHLYGGMDEPQSGSISVFICRLRKKLEWLGVRDMLTTVHGCGYVIRGG